MVVLCSLVLGLSGPGQTAGVSVFVDPMLGALDMTRSAVSTAYLIGTLAGAVAQPRVGRLIDDRGARTALAVVAGLFVLALTGMSAVVGPLTLGLGFAGIRMFGQGGVSLIATTAVAPWFERRRGVAIGVTAAVGSALLSLVPLLSAGLIGLAGWRPAWLVLAALVLLVLGPIARLGLVDRPADLGQDVDGESAQQAAAAGRTPVVVPDRTRAQAVRTPMFWAITGGVTATGMISTGLAFHQIDLLGEQGLTPIEAAANFLPQTAAALLATLAVGAMVDRVAPRWVLAVSMGLLAGAMVAVGGVSPGLAAALYGMAIGAAGASARALEAAALPRLFGVAHLGSIRGVVQALSVGSTAFGPVALSLGRDLSGSYVPVLLVLLVLPVGVALVGLLAPDPGA